MILRIEDTDAALSTPRHNSAIVEPLRQLGIDWDEGPFFQSQRNDLYAVAIAGLVESGAAYFCDLTPAEIAQRAERDGLPAGYHGWSRDRAAVDGEGVVVRFRCPDEGVTAVDDLIRGRVVFPNETLEDFVIRRGDGSPTFLLANAVDDHDMAISHVIRGEDLLNATPKVQLIWEALGYGTLPGYAHLPLLVDRARKKLSKRRDDVALTDYFDRGYLPEAMLNHLALLGWGPPDEIEIRPLGEIVELFDLAAVNKAPAFFDTTKLDYINSAYIKALSAAEFAQRVEPFLAGRPVRDSRRSAQPQPREWCEDRDDDEELDANARLNPPGRWWRDDCDPIRVLQALAGELQLRVSVLEQVPGWIEWILADELQGFDPKAWQKVMVKGRSVAEVLEMVTARLEADDFGSAQRLESIVMGVGDELSAAGGRRVLSQAPVRVAVSASNVGLPLWEPLRLLGRERTLRRLRAALREL